VEAIKNTTVGFSICWYLGPSQGEHMGTVFPNFVVSRKRN